jgi:hypothetical protein
VRNRIHATVVIARRQVLETLLAPGFYVMLAIGIGLGYSIVVSFAAAIDSSGFNSQLNPAFDLLARSLAGAFGPIFVEKLFAEGPFLFAFAVSFAPVFLYLTVSSIFRFSMEKTAGAVELVVYGPADGTSYFMAAFLKDILFGLVALLTLMLFLAAAASVNNLLLGPMFFSSLPVLFFLALAIFAYAIFCSIVSYNASSAIALFIAIHLFFLVILGGSLTIASIQVRTASSIAAMIIQWISPFFCASLCFRAFSAGSTGGFLGALSFLLVLTAALLVLSHASISRRRVRA